MRAGGFKSSVPEQADLENTTNDTVINPENGHACREIRILFNMGCQGFEFPDFMSFGK